MSIPFTLEKAPFYKIDFYGLLRLICYHHICYHHICYHHICYHHICYHHICYHHICYHHICYHHICYHHICYHHMFQVVTMVDRISTRYAVLTRTRNLGERLHPCMRKGALPTLSTFGTTSTPSQVSME